MKCQSRQICVFKYALIQENIALNIWLFIIHWYPLLRSNKPKIIFPLKLKANVGNLQKVLNSRRTIIWYQHDCKLWPLKQLKLWYFLKTFERWFCYSHIEVIHHQIVKNVKTSIKPVSKTKILLPIVKLVSLDFLKIFCFKGIIACSEYLCPKIHLK